MAEEVGRLEQEISLYGDDAWGEHRTLVEQFVRLEEELAELEDAIISNDANDVLSQIADCSILLVDMTRMLGREWFALVVEKLRIKKARRLQ